MDLLEVNPNDVRYNPNICQSSLHSDYVNDYGDDIANQISSNITKCICGKKICNNCYKSHLKSSRHHKVKAISH